MNRAPVRQTWREGTFLRPPKPTSNPAVFDVLTAHAYKNLEVTRDGRQRTVEIEGLFMLDARNERHFIPMTQWREREGGDKLATQLNGRIYITSTPE